MKIYNKNYNPEDYIVVEYFLKSKTNLKEAAWSLAIGQSVGNPNVRSIWETDELFKKHSCIIIDSPIRLESHKAGSVKIGFPKRLLTSL